VVDVADCGSGGGGSAQLRPDQCDGGVIGVVAGSGGGGWIRRWQPNQNDGGVDLVQGQSADVGEASLHDVIMTGASAMVGVELCGRPVPVAIRRRASIC
jgi:hypothetical protein